MNSDVLYIKENFINIRDLFFQISDLYIYTLTCIYKYLCIVLYIPEFLDEFVVHAKFLGIY